MCYSILYFKPFTEKNDSSKSLNPEGPLGSYLCDVTLPVLLIRCQFLSCRTKEVNRIFTRWKNLIFLSFLQSIFLFPVFLFPVFLCSFIIPFMEDSVVFNKLIFNVLLFLIVDLRHIFATFLLIVTTVVFNLKVVHNHSNYLFCSFCSRLSTDLICNNWTRIRILQTIEDFILRDLHEGEADKEKKNV